MTKDESIYFKFERLEVWQHAREFTNSIYSVTANLPKNELFGITSQLRRAASSIMLNIAEGSERQSDQDFQRFLRMALASLEEVVAALYIASDQRLIEERGFKGIYKDAAHLSAQIKSFLKALRKP